MIEVKMLSGPAHILLCRLSSPLQESMKSTFGRLYVLRSLHAISVQKSVPPMRNEVTFDASQCHTGQSVRLLDGWTSHVGNINYIVKRHRQRRSGRRTNQDGSDDEEDEEYDVSTVNLE